MDFINTVMRFCRRKCSKRSKQIKASDIAQNFDNALVLVGISQFLRGITRGEQVIKHTACPKNMFEATLHARPFDSEEEAIDAILHHKIKPGDTDFTPL